MNSVKTATLRVAGVDASIRRNGSGAPLLYLHGVGGDEAWLPFLDGLAAAREVIAVEHPGFGSTPLPEWLDSVSDLASFYQELIEQMGMQRVHVMGAGLGGWIALEMAIQTTHRISSLSLIAPAGVHFKGVSKADIFMLSAEQFVKQMFFDVAKAEAHWARFRGSGEPDTDMRLKNSATAARLAWQPYFYRRGIKTWLHRVAVPTNIVWGREDRIFSCDHAPLLASLLPRAQVSLIANCGHLPHVEAARDFVERFESFEKGMRQ